MYLSRFMIRICAKIFAKICSNPILAVLFLVATAFLTTGLGCGSEDAPPDSNPRTGQVSQADTHSELEDGSGREIASSQDPNPVKTPHAEPQDGPAGEDEGESADPARPVEPATREKASGAVSPVDNTGAENPTDIQTGNVEATMQDVRVAPEGPEAQSEPVAANHPMAPDRLKGQTRRPTGETVMIDGKYEVPVILAGREMQRSALENAPGYYPPDDPEHESVERGYRIVEERDIQLEGGMPTAEALADMILYCLEEEDARCLHDLRIHGVEFENNLWPEFPESRPATHIEAKHAWFYLHKTCWSGASDMLSEFGQQRLVFKKITCTEGLIRYTNFNMLSGVLIHAENEFGEEVIIKNAHTFCQAGDVWKVYMYKDL